MRKSIFEIIENNFNLYSEVIKINTLLTKRPLNNDYTIEKYFDANCLNNWKHRGTLVSCYELREKCRITEVQLVPQAKIETFLAFLEYAYNIIQLTKYRYYSYSRTYPETILLTIDNLLLTAAKLNYEFKKIDDEKFIIIEKNAMASAVAEILEDTKPVEYNHFLLRGNIEGKRNILKLLANKFEEIKPSLKKNGYNDLADDLGYLFNNLGIRHKNDIESTISKEEIEEWYDKTYDMFLLSVLANNHVKIRPDIKALKQKLTS